MKPGKSYESNREGLRQVLLSAARLLEVGAETATGGHMNTLLNLHKSIFDRFGKLTGDTLPATYEVQAVYQLMLGFMLELIEEVQMARPDFMANKTVLDFHPNDTTKILTEVLAELKRRHNVMVTGETAIKSAHHQADEAFKEAEKYRQENLALLERNEQLHDRILELQNRLTKTTFNTFFVPD